MELYLDENSLWKKRIRAPKIIRFHVARNNSSHALVEANITGVNRTYLLNLKSGELSLIQGLDSDYYGTLSPDGHFLHFLKDTKGDQHGPRCRMPIGGDNIEVLTPELSDYYAPRIEFSNDSKICVFPAYKNEDVILYGLYFDNKGALFEKKVLFNTKGDIGIVKLSRDGRFVAITSPKNNKDDETKILLLNADSGIEHQQLKFDSTTVAYVNLFIPLSNKLVLTTENSELKKYLLWDFEENTLKEIFTNLKSVISVCDVSKDGKKILIDALSQAVENHIVYTLEDDSFISLENPDGISFLSFILDDEVLLLNSSSQHKSQFLSYDLNTGRFKKNLLDLQGAVPAKSAKDLRFLGAKCEQVQGWLKIPEGKGPFPTIIELPGGPSCACSWYEPDVDLEHGFARLTINYHGSYSFGFDFQKSIIGRVGELELEDMVAARSWLIQQGISKPDQIFLMGGSYGGYLTLWGMVRRPDLWKAGLARVPIADFVAVYEDENGSLKKYDSYIFGGSLEEKPELYIKSSPITYIENLKAPVQIIAGINDTRCPKRQIDLFVDKGRMLGKDIELYWYDEGHSTDSKDEAIHQIELRLKFLKKVIES